MRLIILCAAALLVAGCSTSTVSSTGGPSLFAASGVSSPRPKTIVVTDFTMSSDIVVIDRSFTQRLERKIGPFPTYERKLRTAERVNDEIVATIVVTLRDAGLDAQPGSEEGLSLKDDAVLVSGKLRPNDPAAAKKHEIGIGNGRSGVVADMTVSSFSGFGKRQLLAFAAEAPNSGASGRTGEAKLSPKAAAATNAAIAQALTAEKVAPEKLSPDVEAAARKIGRAAGENILAYARQQGWLAAQPDAPPAEEKKVAKKPPVKPEKKPAA
jgi:hypothetical protein